MQQIEHAIMKNQFLYIDNCLPSRTPAWAWLGGAAGFAVAGAAWVVFGTGMEDSWVTQFKHPLFPLFLFFLGAAATVVAHQALGLFKWRQTLRSFEDGDAGATAYEYALERSRRSIGTSDVFASSRAIRSTAEELCQSMKLRWVYPQIAAAVCVTISVLIYGYKAHESESALDPRGAMGVVLFGIAIGSVLFFLSILFQILIQTSSTAWHAWAMQKAAVDATDETALPVDIKQEADIDLAEDDPFSESQPSSNPFAEQWQDSHLNRQLTGKNRRQETRYRENGFQFDDGGPSAEAESPRAAKGSNAQDDNPF
jgi:hypothetical protein